MRSFAVLLPLLVTFCVVAPPSDAAIFDIQNNCTYPVWAATWAPSGFGGGKRLDQGQSWNINIPPGTIQARIWGRTNCKFDGSGRGSCQTGNCNGLLECKGYGSPPNTLAEIALNQPNNLDYFDISNVDGFNIPMEFSPVKAGTCKDLRCTSNIVGECPAELKAPGGCNNPCTVYKTNEYCCTSGPGSCGETTMSKFFKQRCPDAYSYPQDDKTSLFSCPAGTNYKVFFCPQEDPTSLFTCPAGTYDKVIFFS